MKSNYGMKFKKNVEENTVPDCTVAGVLRCWVEPSWDPSSGRAERFAAYADRKREQLHVNFSFVFQLFHQTNKHTKNEYKEDNFKTELALPKAPTVSVLLLETLDSSP